MPLNVVATFTVAKHKLALDHGVRLERDSDRLSELTYFTPFAVIVRGRRSAHHYPLFADRINIILQRDPLHSPLPPYGKMTCDQVYYATFDEFQHFYETYDPPTYVLGGPTVFRFAMSLRPANVYLTEIYDYVPTVPLTVFMDKLPACYHLTHIAPVQCDKLGSALRYRFLNYQYLRASRSCDAQYHDLVDQVLRDGNPRLDRTGTGTLSLFGMQLHLDISDTVPLLTTKRVAWKHCIEELLWFLRGDTDAKLLQARGVRIWDGNTSRAFLDAHGLAHYPEGILGPGYGWNWRAFGAPYDLATGRAPPERGVDQIQFILKELERNPFSRRLMVSTWNPAQLAEVALPPCHFAFQFYVEEDEHQRKFLSCHFMMRSTDLGCGLPFNLFSYAALTYIIALKVDMKPKRLVFTGSDVHVYRNHVDALQEQLERKPTTAPKLWVNPGIKHKTFDELSLADFDVVGYYPEPAIRMPMAV